MKVRHNTLTKYQSKNAEIPCWCPSGPEMISSQSRYSNSAKKEPSNLIDSIYSLLYSEQRELADEPDKIEAHRRMMETPRETVAASPKMLVTERQCATERKGKIRMLQIVNQTLDENEIIRKYLSQTTESSNSAMLFLAGTIFSSNRYIFELLNEGGFFSPKSQKLVNSVASDFINQSKKLSNIVLKAERLSGDAIEKAVVSCVNEFVSTSNKLSKGILLEYESKANAIDSAKEALLRNFIQKRNQISGCLYDFFQRTLEVEKPIASASKSGSCVSHDEGSTMRLLADAERFTKFLYAGVCVDRLASSTGIDDITNTKARKCISQRDHEKISTDSTTDMSDAMSTASSFMDYLNISSLSGMLDEDELIVRGGGIPDTHLDAVFERMNLSLPNESSMISKGNEEIPNEKVKNNTMTSNRWAWGSSNKTNALTKTPAREKRKQMIIARNQARQEKKEKKFGKKKSRAKASEADTSKINNRSVDQKGRFEEGEIGFLIEI